MGRIGFAKVGFVLLGAWLVVTTISETIEYLRFPLPLRQVGVALVYSVALTVLGVLIVFWSDTLARLTTGGGEEPEGAALCLVDIQSTGIGLLGLWLLASNVPRLLDRLSRSATFLMEHGTEEDALIALGGLYREQIVVGLISTALGLWFVLRSRSIAQRWTRRLDKVESRPDGVREPAMEPRYDFRLVQAVAFSVFGLYLLSDALPNLGALGLRNGFRSPFEWKLEQPVWEGDAEFLSGKSSFVIELLRAALGIALFFGARGLASLWHRARTMGTSSAATPS